MNEALKNTILLADHDEAVQQLVVDAVEKIVFHYLSRNMHEVAASLITTHQHTIERIALRAVRTHFVNASNIY
jgi:hypothetical protein